MRSRPKRQHCAHSRRRVLQSDLGAVAAQQLSGDRQAETGAAAVAVAPVVEPGEPVEDPLALGRRDAARRRRSRPAADRWGWAPPPRAPRWWRGAPRCRRGWSGPGRARPAPRRRPAAHHRSRSAAPAPAPTHTAHDVVDQLAEVHRAVAAGTASRRRCAPAGAGPRRGPTAGRPPAAGRPGRSPPSPSRCATSSCVRIVANGLRSSCAASATKERWVRRAVATRSSIALRVVARALISSRVAGTGRRSSARLPSMRAAPLRSASTGRSASPMTRQAMAAQTRRTHREDDQQQGA